MAAIEVQNATKQYGANHALSEINLTLDPGDFLSVVGPSGSGKTTLLRLLDLLEQPTQGKVMIDGIETGEIDENQRLHLRRQIGIVFQHNVMLNTTVYGNVAYPLKVRGARDGLRKKVSDALERVGLDGYENRKAIRLSGGEVQRVALAQALIYTPKILLLDEPTANLDPRNASVIENIVSRANKEDQVTTVMSTHNPAQAQQAATKVLILRSGAVAEFGDASVVFNKPSPFLSSFMETENAYSGIAKPIENGIAIIDLGNEMKIVGITRHVGNVTVFLDPDDITVTRSPVSDVDNSLKGKIVALIDRGNQVQLEFNCGKKVITRIPKSSFKALKLEIESEAYLSFKASDVEVSGLATDTR
jgi:tungstate transport system ATP-binding protein